MFRRKIQIYTVLFSVVVLVSSEKSKKGNSKIERKQGMVDLRYEYSPIGFLNGGLGLHGTFGYTGEDYNNLPEEAGLGLILGAKNVGNGVYHGINPVGTINRPTSVVVPNVIPVSVKRPVAVPVSAYRAIPVPITHTRPIGAVPVQQSVPIHYTIRKELPRIIPQRNLYHTMSSSKNAANAKYRQLLNGKRLPHPIKYTLPVVNHEVNNPHYIIVNGNNDASVQSPSAYIYQDQPNSVYENTALGYNVPQATQEPSISQYVPVHAKMQFVNVKPSSQDSREPSGLRQFSSTKDIVTQNSSPSYDSTNNKSPITFGTNINYQYLPYRYEHSSNTDYANTMYVTQNVKPQVITTKYEIKDNSQEEINEQNSISSSNFEHYAIGPTSSGAHYESYDIGQTSPASFSEQYQYQYQTSGKDQEVDTMEGQSTNSDAELSKYNHGTVPQYSGL